MSGRPANRKNASVVAIFCGLILVSGALGFGFKLFEMISTIFESPDYRFALPPVLTYLFVAAGFFCMLIVATLRGMFRNVEAPKYRMLELESAYDAEEDRAAVLAAGRPEGEKDEERWWKGDVHP